MDQQRAAARVGARDAGDHAGPARARSRGAAARGRPRRASPRRTRRRPARPRWCRRSPVLVVSMRSRSRQRSTTSSVGSGRAEAASLVIGSSYQPGSDRSTGRAAAAERIDGSGFAVGPRSGTAARPHVPVGASARQSRRAPCPLFPCRRCRPRPHPRRATGPAVAASPTSSTGSTGQLLALLDQLHRPGRHGAGGAGGAHRRAVAAPVRPRSSTCCRPSARALPDGPSGGRRDQRRRGLLNAAEGVDGRRADRGRRAGSASMSTGWARSSPSCARSRPRRS